MAIARKPTTPPIWHDATEESGKIIGGWMDDGHILTVRSGGNGAQRVTSTSRSPAGLARLMLSEAWAFAK